MSGSNSHSVTVMTGKLEELYGTGRLKNVQALKDNLTTDHISMISQEGVKIHLPSWQSTSKMNFKGTQPLRPEEQISSSEKQDKSHFDFRGDAAPIDDVIYQASMTSHDYQHRRTKQLPPVKPDGNINLPDMNPRYWRDSSMAPSLYATDFSDNTEIRHGVEIPEVIKARNDMRRRNVEDVRSTHFRLGNEPLSLNTETGSCYNAKKPLPAVGGRSKDTDELTAAELTQKMIDQERNSAIFREGDYNVTRPKPDSTTFSRDYNTNAKPYKSAAFVEPTRTQKGRFLIDSPLKNAVEIEASRYPGPPPSTDTNMSDHLASSSSALKQLFMQYDTNRSGYVSNPILRRICESLLHPISPVDLEEILRHTMRGKDGAINYQSFVDQFIDAEMKKWPTAHSRLNDNEVQSENHGEKQISVLLTSPFKQQGDLSLDTALLGKQYQTSAHFKFGNDADKLLSIYNKTFPQADEPRQMSARKPPPRHSEVMHKLPGVQFGHSTKQSDFINFQKVSPDSFNNTIAVRDQASMKNKRRHAVNSVVIAGDKERDATDRQKSLSHSSYVPHKMSELSRTSSAPLLKYNYLKSDGALPYPANVPLHSETTEAFASAKSLRTEESNEELHAITIENEDRSKDGKRAHFHLGNDNPNKVSEAMDCFKLHEKDTIAAAGKRNQDDPNFLHHQVSKNTQDLSHDPMAPSIFQVQHMVKKSYYNTVPNPADPLHIKLRSILMGRDTERIGRLDRRTVKNVCKEFQISVSEYAMDNLLERCGSDFGDDTVDYHKFVRSLTLEQIPNDVSAAHNSSIMMKDYRPLDQRSFTNAQLLTMEHMDNKPLEPMPTHFFHVDASGETPFQSLTTKHYIKPELQA